MSSFMLQRRVRMRNMSFSLTTNQIRQRTKTVTRRLGWKTLKPGDLLCACRKCMGLKPSESIERLGTIRVVSVRREPLDAITTADVAREGFRGMSPEEFVRMFCDHMGGVPEQDVTRIEFEYC